MEDDAEGEVHGEGTDVIVLEKVHKTSNHKKHMSTTSLDFEYFPFCWQTSETNQNLLTSNYNQNKLIRQEKCRLIESEVCRDPRDRTQSE